MPRPVFVFPTDARRAATGREQVPPDPVEERRQRLRGRVTVLVFATIFAAGMAGTFFGKDGLLESRRLKSRQESLRQRIEVQRDKVEALQRQIERLKTVPISRERIAREQLGYGKPGEVTFLLPKEGSEAAAIADGEAP